MLLDGVEHVMPMLSFEGFEVGAENMRKIAEADVKSNIELQNAFIDVLLLAFQRNYPGMAASLLKRNLDWKSAPALFHQLMAISIPEAPAGEATVASPSGASTGKRRSRR